MRAINGKEEFMGFPVYKGSLGSLTNVLIDELRTDKKNIVMAINPKKIVLSKNNESACSAFRAASIYIADGVGVLIGARRLGIHIRERITGIDLLENLMKETSSLRIPFFFFGASEKNLNLAINNIKDTYKEINIAGYCNGYIEDKDYVVKRINESKAQILIVALGSPMQELFAKEYHEKLFDVKLILTVGGSIDVLSKKVKRAPGIVQRLNIEWLYRMINQPKRISENRFLLEYIKILRKEIQKSEGKKNGC